MAFRFELVSSSDYGYLIGIRNSIRSDLGIKNSYPNQFESGLGHVILDSSFDIDIIKPHPWLFIVISMEHTYNGQTQLTYDLFSFGQTWLGQHQKN